MRRVSSFWPKTPRFTRFFGVSERRRRRFPGSAPAALLPVGTLLRKPWCFWPEIRILPRRPPSCLVGSRLALVLFRSVPPCAAPHPPRTPRTLAPPLPPFAFAPSRRPALLRSISHLLPPSPRRARWFACPAKPSPGLASLSAPRLPSSRTNLPIPPAPLVPFPLSRTHLLIPPLTALRPVPRSIPHTFDDFATRRRPSCPSSTGGRPHFPRWASAAARFVAGEGLSDARPGCLCVAKSSKVCRSSVRPRRPRQSRRLRRMVVPSTMRGNEQGVDFCS